MVGSWQPWLINVSELVGARYLLILHVGRQNEWASRPLEDIPISLYFEGLL